jgi:chromosome segregation ATPase
MPEKDLLDDLLEPVEDPKPGLNNEELASMKEQLEALEKEKQGLLKGVKEERRKRQELKGRLDEVTTTVNHILTTKEELAAQQLEAKTAEANVNGIPVEFTDDGDAFVPTDKLTALTSQYEEKIKDLEDKLEQVDGAASQRAEAQNTINSIVGENEAFGPAYGKYQSARKWVEDKVIDFQRLNNIQGALSSGQALDHVFDDDMKQEFNSTFENIDLVDVITAEDSIHHFRTMLSNMAEATWLRP